MAEARRRAAWFALIALALAGMAAYTFSQRVLRWEREVGPAVSVLAAARDIVAREPITAEMLTVTKVPARYAGGLVTALPEAIAGQASLVGLKKGDLLTPALLRPMAQIETDERLVTFRNGGVILMEPGITAGDRIDVIASLTENGGPVTRIILSDVQVAFSAQSDQEYEIRLVLAVTDLITMVELENSARQLRIIRRDGLI